MDGGESYYATIADAVAAANKSGNVTINLLRDYDFEANEPGYGYTTSFLAEGESTARNNMLVVSGNSITFDLGGHTISNLFNNTFNVTGSKVVFQNGEMRVGQLYYSDLSGTKVYTSENDRTCSYIVYVTNATDFTVNNLTTYGGINVSGSTATINDLSFSGTKFYAVCSQSNSEVTLNGGTYTKAIKGAAGYLFWIENGSTMNITGGTYTKGNAIFINGANPVITGGTFDFDPSAYVAAGYEAVQSESGNNWKVQVKNYTCTVYTPSTSLSGSLDAPVVSRVRKDEAVVNFGSFSNLETGQVIELTEDVYYNGTVSIPAGVVLDFNGHKLTATKVRGLNGNAILQNTLPYNDGQPNMDAYVNVSYEGDVENVEIRGGTYTFNPQTYTPSGIGVVVDGTSYNAPGLYFVPSIPEALVYYADYNFISTNLGEVKIGYNGSFGKDADGNISSSAGTFVFNDIKKSESINDAFIFQMNPQEEYATSQSYNDWICDYVVSVKEGENGTPEEPGLGLWGMYGGMTVGFGIGFNLAANEKYPLISSLGFNFDYTGIKTTVSTFICGTLPFNNDLIGKTVYVDLCLFPAEGFNSSKVNKDQNYKYIVVKRFDYKF